MRGQPSDVRRSVTPPLSRYVCAMGVELVRRPEDVSADWLTAVLRDAGAAPAGAEVTGFEAAAIGTGQMSQSHRFTLTWNAGATAAPRERRPEGRGLRRDEPHDRRRARDLRARDPLLPGGGAAHRRPARGAATSARLRRRARAGSPSCSRTPRPQSRATRSRAARVAEARLAMRELARLHAPVWDDEQLDAADWLNQPPVDRPGAGAPAAGGLPRALRRAPRAGAPRRRRAVRGALRPVARRPQAPVLDRARRLPPRQPAVRRAGQPEAAHGRRLADRQLGSAAARRVLLPRRRARSRATAARTRRRCCASTTTRCSPRRRGLRLGRVLGGVPPPGVPRRADGGRRADARRAHRARRRHVHDVARAPRPADPRPATRRSSCRREQRRRRRCARPATRAATRRAPRSSGTRAGTSTRSPRTGASAPTCGSASTRTSASPGTRRT